MSACFERCYKIQLYTLSLPENVTTILEPYNTELWELLLEINWLILRMMHYKKDIRANYVVYICGL